MTTPWHMARVASRRQLPKPRKMHGPVGERPSDHEHYRNGVLHESRDREYHCNDCGYHVCSCKPVERIQLPRTIAGRILLYMALREHSDLTLDDLTLDGLRAILESDIRLGE